MLPEKPSSLRTSLHFFASRPKNLPLKATPTSGALIVVAGRYKNFDPLQPNIHSVTTRVVQLFRQRGYSSERIQFLATDPTLPEFDALATRANLEAAITTWARDKVGSGRPLTIYMMDHGAYDKLYLDKPNGQWVDPAQLDGWLSQLEAAQPGSTVNVIIEACLSGSFIDPQQQVSKAGRVVITSTGARNNAQASRTGANFSDRFLSLSLSKAAHPLPEPVEGRLSLSKAA